MWEFIAASGIGALIVERLFDYVRRRKIARKDQVVQFARVAFAQATKLISGARDKQTVHHQFDKLLLKGLDAAGLQLGDAERILVDEAFEQLWKVWSEDVLDNALQELAKAGERAERFADGLIRQANPVTWKR